MERVWFLVISFSVVFFCSVWSLAHGSSLDESAGPLLISPGLSFASPMLATPSRSAQAIRSQRTPPDGLATTANADLPTAAWTPAGSIFATIAALACSGIAAIMFSPIVNHRDGFEFDDPRTVGFVMIALAGTSMGAAIQASIRPRERGTNVRVALNGVTIRW